VGVTMKERIASCSCGRLSARTIGEPVRISICHCFACQRRTGSVFGAQARFTISDVQISGKSHAFTREADDGGTITFHFCPYCGATVHYEIEGLEDYVAIPVGAFADSSFPAPAFSVYEDRMHSWVVMPKNIEHMA
jgi:hypothetical protein